MTDAVTSEGGVRAAGAGGGTAVVGLDLGEGRGRSTSRGGQGLLGISLLMFTGWPPWRRLRAFTWRSGARGTRPLPLLL